MWEFEKSGGGDRGVGRGSGRGPGRGWGGVFLKERCGNLKDQGGG